MRFAAAVAATLVALPLTAYPQQQDGRALAAACAMCHGTDGRSVGGAEPLAGMPKADVVRKMNEFRTGTKPATVMHQISKGYTEQQIQALADYFSAQPAKK
jgi:cytochrome c553